MSNTSAPEARRKSVADLLDSIDAAENPELELLNHIIKRAREKNEELAEAIRYCAIPRHFDADIIGILRAAPNDRETNTHLLEGLSAFSFVRAQPDNGYTYDNSTRNTLLTDWQTEAHRAQFDRYNQRLVTLYNFQYNKA